MGKVLSQDLGCFQWPRDELAHPLCMGSASPVSGEEKPLREPLREAALC